MQLHECSYRRVTVEASTGASRILCEMAQTILGFEGDADCQVDERICEHCGRGSPPTTAAPNSVVASVVWNIAARILTDNRLTDDNIGRVQQAQRYVLPALALDLDVPSPGHAPSSAARGYPAGKVDDCSFPHPNRSAASAKDPAEAWPLISHSARRARVGIVGYNAASGLGYMMRDLAMHGIADQWLVAAHERFPPLTIPNTHCQIEIAPQAPSLRTLSRWLNTLDWVLLAELSPFAELPRLARRLGVRVGLIPMWEWMSPCARWLRFVDMLICPTRHSFEMFRDWKTRFGFTWDVHHLAWPVALDRFRFRLREKCERFVFVNGTGGCALKHLDGASTGLRRKGLDVVLGAARLAPAIPWIVYTQTNTLRSWPKNVNIKPPPADNAALYEEGDVCVQPSRWEGLGLQLLECQAAGLPLVTTDAPPMNEYQPMIPLRSHSWDWGQVTEAQPFRIPVSDPWSLSSLVQDLYGTDVSTASQAARIFVERHHNWNAAAPALRELFDSTIESRFVKKPC